MQIGTNNQDYIIDPFPMFDNIREKLKFILEDPLVTKLVFDGKNEFDWVTRDFQIFLDGALDVQKLFSFVYNLKQPASLKSAVGQLVPWMDFPKTETFSDWRRRPLTDSMIKYAQNDVYGLLELWIALQKMVR